MKSLLPVFDSPYSRLKAGYSAILLLALMAGIYLRWRMVALGRSLWLDPAMLVWNVVERGYAGLFFKLDENQAAPYGFLVLLKTAGRLCDYTEASLLFFPFCFSAAALLLFSRLATEILGHESASFAVWPLAVSSTAVYYAGEVKQYSLDLFATTLLLLLAWRCVGETCSKRDLLRFMVGVVACAWLSHSSLLVSVSLLPVLWFASRNNNDPGINRTISAVTTVVLTHHLLLYFTQMRPAASSDLYAYHGRAFAPWPPWLDWVWYKDALLSYFEFPLGSVGATAIPLLAASLGILALRGRRFEAMLALLPLLAVLGASALRLYPWSVGEHDIHSRLVLFTLPCVCLLIGRGLGSVSCNRPAVALVLLAALVYPVASRSFENPGYLRQEMKPLVADLRSQLEPGDQVYVYFAAHPAFRFYTRDNPISYLRGRPVTSPEADLRLDAQELGPGRVWVVFSHFYSGEDRIFRAVLEERGERLMKHIHHGAVLELYSLREPIKPIPADPL